MQRYLYDVEGFAPPNLRPAPRQMVAEEGIGLRHDRLELREHRRVFGEVGTAE
jgi:hypothetical protein